MNISLTRSSSRMATWVSCPLAVMIISLLIRKTPYGKGVRPLFRQRIGRNRRAERANDRQECSLCVAHFRSFSYQLIGEPTHPHVEDEAEARERGHHRRA